MDPRLARFASFVNDIGISVDEQSVRFVQSEVHGFGVIALSEVTPGKVLVRIPKTAILSVQTAALWQNIDNRDQSTEKLARSDADSIRLSRDQWCPPLFQLTAAVLFETFLGEKSPWHRYLDILPSSVADIGVPLAEVKEDVQSIAQGTAIDVLNDKMHCALRSAFDAVKKLFVVRSQQLRIAETVAINVTFEQFVLAYAWVTSRAFQVDSFHGNSMVPVADMFNHSTDGEHVHVEGTGGDESDDESDDDENEEEVTHRESTQKDNSDAKQNGEEEDDDLKIVCVRGAAAGEELFNTFGQKCNTVLYLNYGFTEPDNTYDTAFVHKNDVEHVLKCFSVETGDSNRKMTPQRRSCIQAASVVVEDDLLDGFFQISTDSFCHGLMVLVYLHVAPWKILAPISEDEFELLEHLMQLSIDDVILAGRSQMAQVISEIVEMQVKKFPAGTNLLSDQTALEATKALTPFKMHILRIRIGQRRALQTALGKVLDTLSRETNGPSVDLGRDGARATEPKKKRAKIT